MRLAIALVVVSVAPVAQCLSALGKQRRLATIVSRPDVVRVSVRSDFAYRSSQQFGYRKARGTQPTLPPRRYSVALRGGLENNFARNENMSLAGKLIPALSKLVITPSRTKSAYAELARAVDLREFSALALIGWGLFPFVRFVYERWTEAKGADKKFTEGYVFKFVKNTSQAAKVGAFIYAIDCVAVILNALGFPYTQQAGFSHKAANVSLIILVSMRIQYYKRYLLTRAIKKRPDELRRWHIIDRLLNVVLYVATAGVIIDKLKLKFGTALSSLFAFGGVGTLVFSLASKDLATQLVSGLALSATDRFSKEDKVELGDGMTGRIRSVGLLFTEVRGNNEVVSVVPNSQISNQRTSNLSRGRRCQVKQTLRFFYNDISKMPEILSTIKAEIMQSCPELITDGSRPFRVHWREFTSDHLEVVVDCRFNLPPTGTKYYDNRQKVLEAIAKAVEKVGVEFAIPSYVIKREDVTETESKIDSK